MTATRGEFCVVAPDVRLGRDVRLYNFVNLYGCEIGDDTRIGTFVEIQRGARVGARCKISSHTFICEGVEIEDEVFIGHGVQFINDRRPRAANPDGSPQTEANWTLEHTLSGAARPSAPARRSWAASRSVRARWSARARSSPAMCRPTRLSRATRRAHSRNDE